MVTYAWDSKQILDFAAGVGVNAGTDFDPQTDVIRVTDPAIQATQVDAFAAGDALAFVLTRAPDGTPLTGGTPFYVFIPDMSLGQVGAGTGNGPGANFQFAGGGRFVIGDGITGTAGDDDPNDPSALFAGATSGYFLGLGGSDTIDGSPGPDRFLGNLGADRLSGGGGNDSLYGGKDDDVVIGGDGDDLVAGDLGNDVILPGPGFDFALGGAGLDRFLVGYGDGTYRGGGDDDLFSSVTVDFGGVADNGLAYGVVIDLQGDRGDDTFKLHDIQGEWTVAGGQGNDTVEMFGAIAKLFFEGGPGDDSVVAAAPGGDAIFSGGDDADYFFIDGLVWSGFQLSVDLGAGNDDLVIDGPVQQPFFVRDGPGADRIQFRFDVVADNGIQFGGRIDLDSDDDPDTYVGGGSWATIRGGLSGDELQLGSGDERVEVLRAPGTGEPTRVINFEPAHDILRFASSYTNGESVNVFEGADGKGAGAADNVVAATAGGWTLDSFDTFLKAGGAAIARPGFYIFYDTSVGYGRIFWDANMMSTQGAVPVVDLPDFTSPGVLSGISSGLEFVF
ncbi:MAG: calcium-binding protein [Alphaproteobacteria bacterium]